MSGIQSRCKQPVGANHRKIAVIRYGCKNGVLRGVRLGKSTRISRIDFDDIGFFVNDLGLVITKARQFMSELIVGRLFHYHADQFGAPQRDAGADGARRFASFVSEGIKRPGVQCEGLFSLGSEASKGSRNRYLVD